MSEIRELPTGDYLAIGKTVSPETPVLEEGRLVPIGASFDANETAIVIPRRYIVEAARELLRNEDIN